MTDHPDSMQWHRLTALVGLATITGRLQDTRPVSVLIIGRPGSGKTALLERYRVESRSPVNAHVLFATNASSWGLSHILKRQVPAGVSTIIAPEFQTWIYRKGAVWDALLGLLLPAIEEGVYDVYNGPDKTSYYGARIGLIAAMTDDSFNSSRSTLEGTGLLSRFLVLRWERKGEDVKAARKRFNAGDATELQRINADVGTGKHTVAVAARVADVCTDYCYDGNPDQTQRNTNRLIALAKAYAFTLGEKSVTLARWREFVATFGGFLTWES